MCSYDQSPFELLYRLLTYNYYNLVIDINQPFTNIIFELYKYKLKNEIKPFFLGGREHLAMHRSGQILFLPHAK
ncbi:hypothetical protein COM49_16905 [Bacillus pseudomycoides]|nr:hypothetical protein COO06_15355 [Bacillus pseudomycoides]PGD99181.1 hypothetical protein COM50_09815 [Bacillus pseudomycoides]PGE01716.1 hypothetical protein COM49_16905 [Bacillus pseudomycoides]PHE68718.1 hypothetical protein COF69_11115 [Bacillus pseudomycoides]PHG23056.1 hypothetical protein COI47_11520 [Bacillus pseudomycoides]